MPALPAASAGIAPTGNTFLPAQQVAAPAVPGASQLSQFLNIPGDVAAAMSGAPAVPQTALAPAAAATSPIGGLGALFPTSALP